jgi:hypothetical protein
VAGGFAVGHHTNIALCCSLVLSARETWSCGLRMRKETAGAVDSGAGPLVGVRRSDRDLPRGARNADHRPTRKLAGLDVLVKIPPVALSARRVSLRWRWDVVPSGVGGNGTPSGVGGSGTPSGVGGGGTRILMICGWTFDRKSSRFGGGAGTKASIKGESERPPTTAFTLPHPLVRDTLLAVGRTW